MRILLVDDHPAVIEGFRLILSTKSTVDIVGEARTGKQAVERARDLLPEIVLMDVKMPEMDGFEATERIHTQQVKCGIILVSGYEEAGTLERFMQSSANGFVLKSEEPEYVLEAVEKVLGGDEYISPGAVRLLRKAQSLSGKQCAISFTDRQIEIIQLLAQGLRSDEIGQRLFISPRTVRKHRELLLKKCGVHNVIQLIEIARKQNLIK
jgi:DNA-binding NarL/FixJ family response regulator